MSIDAWLPANFLLPDDQRSRRVTFAGPNWQIYETDVGTAVLAQTELAGRWRDAGLVSDSQLSSVVIAGESFEILTVRGRGNCRPIADCIAPQSAKETRQFAMAFQASRASVPDASLHDALYVHEIARLLPTWSLSPPMEDDVLFGQWLTGGVPVSVHAVRRLRTLTSWMGPQNLATTCKLAGFEVNDVVDDDADRPDWHPPEGAHGTAPAGNGQNTQTTSKARSQGGGLAGASSGPFTLAGRPALTQFINEHVIDIVANPARYATLGIGFPSAIILHGPPGCGKTFAVDRLIEYLGWPSYQVDAASVASPYIHATSKKVAEVFAQAMENAPAIVVMDELEAFVSDRQMGSGSSTHRVEEVAEFLRRIPEAISKKVMVIGMTNRIDMIDSAILRRGRFDHIVKVDMASSEEVQDLLDKLLGDLPCEGAPDTHALAEMLQGRPLSDVAFVVREAARLAARSGLAHITAVVLAQAADATPDRADEAASPARKIGFT